MSADESESVHELRSSPVPHSRSVDAIQTVAAPAHHTVSGALTIDLPPVFKGDGTESFTSWSRRFEVAVQAMTPPEVDLATVMSSVLPTRLADAAFLYWDSLPSSTQKDYDLVKDKLKEVFGPKYSLPFFQTHVNARPRKPCEKLRRFVAGLDPTLQSKIHEMGAEDLAGALRIANRCERARAALQLTAAGSSHIPSSEQVAMIRPQPTDAKLLQAVEELKLTVTSLKHEVQQLREKQSYPAQRLDSSRDRSSSSNVQYGTRSASLSSYHARQHPRDYCSPERRYHRDPESHREHPSSPVPQRFNEWDKCEKHDQRTYHSQQPSQYSRYNYPDNNRYRRSPSPAPRRVRDDGSYSRTSVRFQSPERPAHFTSGPQGNFH
ncbi:ubiquitin carboxyl-terminal hydrolase 36/42 [Sarotherodon galilaeus]